MPDFYTLREAAQHARCAEITLRRAIRKGKLNAGKIGGRGGYRLTEEDLQAWLYSTQPVEVQRAS